MIYLGSCHCGKVRYEVKAPVELEVTKCNCSICTKSGYLHLIVPESEFRLLAGADCLTTYTFGTHTAKHLFCKFCGIKSFYRPRSHPEAVSVNVWCLDQDKIKGMKMKQFDGQNWEQTMERLRGNNPVK